MSAAIGVFARFDTQIAICDGGDLLALERSAPFGSEAPDPDIVRFVSVLVDPKPGRLPAFPFGVPSSDDWYVRLIGRKGRFIIGTYRRHMKTISYLGRIDAALGASVTTRNWNTIGAVLKILKRDESYAGCSTTLM